MNKSIVETFFSGKGLNLGESIVKELVDIDDPSNNAKISSGGITTVGHFDDKGISNSAANLEKELVAAGFEMKKSLAGDKTFTNHKTGDMVKLNGTKAEIKTSTSKYNVDLSKFNTKQIMSILTNKFPENTTKIKEAGTSPLAGPKLRRYAFGVTEVTIDPSKHTMTISHNGNMGARDADIVSNVQSLIQKLKSGSNTDGSYIESIFRKMKPAKVDGSPDYSYTEIYKLPKAI
jgi:hypothetical protein